ncbi:hypothetical protein Hanom_Chr03g00224451 [Helianthus anomalus]
MSDILALNFRVTKHITLNDIVYYENLEEAFKHEKKSVKIAYQQSTKTSRLRQLNLILWVKTICYK